MQCPVALAFRCSCEEHPGGGIDLGSAQGAGDHCLKVDLCNCKRVELCTRCIKCKLNSSEALERYFFAHFSKN